MERVLMFHTYLMEQAWKQMWKKHGTMQQLIQLSRLSFHLRSKIPPLHYYVSDEISDRPNDRAEITGLILLAPLITMI